MVSNSAEIAIPSEAIEKWQRIVDLLAEIVRVPSAVVCKLEPPDFTHYTVVASSKSQGNPFPVHDSFSMDIGTFCETVIKSRLPLLVINGLEDDRWRSAPELKVGMISYLGYPIAWPSGRMFGTICVLDDKANPYSEAYQRLLLHFRDALEADLQTLVRLNEELENHKAHLSQLFERVPEAVVMLGPDSRILRVNPEFTKLFGYTEDEALGRDISGLLMPADGRASSEDPLLRMFSTDEAIITQTVRKGKQGAPVPISAICVPIPTNGGEKAGYLICRDLTDAIRLEQEQRRHQEMELELAHLNRVATLAELSASIAHELNQPLTGILANCGTCLQLLTRAPEDLEGAREAVLRTLRDGERAAEVITRLRALFSKKKPVFEALDLNEAAQDVIALSSADIREAEVNLRTELAEQLPVVWADRIQVQQVMLNLIRNALDAMASVRDRPRNLLVRTEPDHDTGVRFCVKDAGIGLPDERVGRLFDAFFTTKEAGMGVGLAVSRSIVESHLGRIWATPNDGPGATFFFSIPGLEEAGPIPLESRSSADRGVTQPVEHCQAHPGPILTTE